jgi:hypothetical protein
MRRRLSRIIGAGGLALLLTALWAGPASAQPAGTGRNENDLVVLTGRLVVPEGETVGAAVIFDGPAAVNGTVDQALVVFNGDVEISGTVRKDVVVFNGDLIVRSGAEVGGNLVSQDAATIEEGATVRGDQQTIAGRIDIGDIGLASRFAWWLGYSVSTLVLGLLLLLIAPGLDGAIARVARERIGAAIGLGALSFFVLPVAAGVLLVTVVGIPLGLFVLLALALVYTVGYVAGAHGVGRLVMKPPSSRWVAFLIGWVILRVIALVPVLGGLAWLLAAIFGLGLLVVAARRTSPDVDAALGTPAPPPMPA